MQFHIRPDKYWPTPAVYSGQSFSEKFFWNDKITHNLLVFFLSFTSIYGVLLKAAGVISFTSSYQPVMADVQSAFVNGDEVLKDM